MSDEPIRFIDTDGQSEYVSPVKPLPVDIQGATLSLDANGVEIKNDAGNPIPTIDGLEIPAHDYIALTYTGSNLTGVVYKTGGAGGTTVATLTLAYDGNDNLTSVTKS
jgi:hypothetical protein